MSDKLTQEMLAAQQKWMNQTMPSQGSPGPEITQVRGKTHGSFRENAAMSQMTKDLWSSAPQYSQLPPVARETLDMIALKVSRILSGHWDFEDHWVDIGGYAELVRQEIRSQKQPGEPSAPSPGDFAQGRAQAAAERRHGQYAMPDGWVWDSGTGQMVPRVMAGKGPGPGR